MDVQDVVSQQTAMVPAVAPRISSLPPEIVAYILSFVTSTAVLATAVKVCREWYANCVEALWSTLAPTAFSQLVSIAHNVATSSKNRLLLNFDFGGSATVLRFVKKIDLTKVKYFDSEPTAALNRILFHTTNLQVAQFDNCLWIKSETIAPLVNCLRLAHLSLSGCAQVTSLPITQMPNLDTLLLAHCERVVFNERVVAELCTDRLKHVHIPIYYLKSSTATVAALLRRFASSLENLVLDSLLVHAQQSDFSAAAFENAPPLPNLLELHLSFCAVPDSTLAALYAPRLTTLTVAGSHEVDAISLSTLVKSKPHLRTLNLPLRPLSDSDAIQILGLTPDSGPAVQLETLNLDYVPALTDEFVYALDSMSNLKCLSLKGNINISDDAAIWVSDRFPGIQFFYDIDAMELAALLEESDDD
ncbi:hypothetical protein HDU87_005842 [Geranomyces variabilis]|uniref:F-box domain-containing protein n=1 Tax=Geranomyces variabilis TaxID=109894 RepID=A0AAD5TGA1_9FUNG|nr:hypothetical protein HDU87_005842 [Geranomyces variabilis]